MIVLVRTLLAPLLSLVFMNIACGFFNTYVSVRLDIQGYRADTIGIVSAALYGGVLLGSLLLGRWINRVGHIWAFTVFSATSAALIFAHSFWIDPLYWSVLRLLCGVCLAGIFIVVESWFLLQSTAENRGGALSIYLAVFYLALSLGQFVINFAPIESSAPFFITSSLLLGSILPIRRAKQSAPAPQSNAVPMRLIDLFRASPVGFWGGIVSGMVLGATYSLVPVYALTEGLMMFELGLLMAILIFGGLSLQWPMGRWSDKGARRRVLQWACMAASAFSIAIALVGSVSQVLLFAMMWFFGGFTFTIYPLSMAYLCEKVPQEQIVSATGGFVLCYAAGAIAGPLIGAFAMDLLGPAGLFYFIGLVTYLLGASAVEKKSSVPTEK
ncbi:MAG: MFS transporter [Chlamydiia bacterium]|nr:MFS transporter [Chlamydiia bacterium]